jgi:hypothetical protein
VPDLLFRSADRWLVAAAQRQIDRRRLWPPIPGGGDTDLGRVIALLRSGPAQALQDATEALGRNPLFRGEERDRGTGRLLRTDRAHLCGTSAADIGCLDGWPAICSFSLRPAGVLASALGGMLDIAIAYLAGFNNFREIALAEIQIRRPDDGRRVAMGRIDQID